MKKQLLILAMIFAIIFTGCKKDKKSDSLADTPYSQKTVTETKADVEQTGVNVVNEIKLLDNEKGMEACVNLLSLSVKKEVVVVSNNNVLKALKSYQGTKNVRTIFNALRATGSDPVSIVDEFNKVKGIYNYNFITEDFDSIGASTNIVINFPATKTDKDNKTLSGAFTVYVPQVKTGPFTYSNQQVNELPTSLSYDIKVNSVVGLSYQFTAAYDDKGIPSNITSTLTIGTFEFKSVFNYATSASNVNFSIKHGTTTIIDIGGGVNGNFDKTNIENAYHYEYDTVYYGPGMYNVEKNKVIDPDKVLTNANAHFQLMNIKLAGQVDFKDLYTNMNSIDDKEQKGTITNSVAENLRVALINKDMLLIVVYADNNTKIAQAEAYMKETVHTEPGGYSYTERNIDFKMIFADKSKNSLDSYFQDGFKGLFDEIDSFINELNTKYGWSINPVDRPTANS